jgi:hypothetical protein
MQMLFKISPRKRKGVTLSDGAGDFNPSEMRGRTECLLE